MKEVKQKNTLRSSLLTLLLVALGMFLSALAQGGIQSTSGQVVVIAPPPSVIATNSFTNNLIYLFPEKSSLSISNPVPVNITKPGTYTNQTQVLLGTSNTFFVDLVDSYYLHHIGSFPSNTATATISFDTDILGILCLSSNVAMTHNLFGAPGTSYSLTPGFQGYEFGTTPTTDRVTFAVDRRTVTITTSAGVGTLDDLRIITASRLFLSPIADAGTNQSANEFEAVILDGTGSMDPNSPPLPLTYSWIQLSGIPVELGGTDTAMPVFVVPDAPDSGAVLVFQLTVSNGAYSSTDTVAVNINFINSPPTADAGPNQTVAENSLVTLDGSASSDPDNHPLTLQWSQVFGPIVALSGANTVHPTFIAPSVPAGQSSNQVVFQLVVNDGQVNSAESFVTVTAINVNDPPIANAGANQVVSELALVTLNGTGSSDPDGNPLTYDWTQILGPAVPLTGTNTAQPTFTAPELNVGGTNFSVTLTFRLTVSDGAASGTGTVNVRVNNVNHPPIADAGPNQIVPEGATVTLDGTGSTDIDGDPITFSWFQLGGTSVMLTSVTNPTPSFVAPQVGVGGDVLTFRLLVRDAFGRTGTNFVGISVTDANQVPVVNAGTDQTVNEGEVATLNGTASDPDGNALAISWAQVSGPTVSLVNATSLTPAFTAPAVTRDETNVVLRLTADDGFGGVASDDVSIHIANINHAPVAQPPANMTVPEETEVTLVGQATDSDTEEQSQLFYAWTQTGGPEVTIVSSGPNAAFIAPIVTAGGDPNAKVTLTFTLTVTDPNGASGGNSVDVVVANVDHSPTAVAGNQTVNEGSAVTLNGSASSDPDSDPLTFSWIQISGPTVTLLDANTAFPQFTASFVTTTGAMLQFRLTVDDGFGGTNSTTATITVNNINDPPNVSQAQASIPVLWPPNHNMTEVSIVGVIDPNNNATISITGVTQDEPTEGTGDDDAPIDAVINADGTVLLRAERAEDGNGRVYHIHFTASDFEGGAFGTVNVIVPKSKKTDGASDEGELYDSTQ